jgi:hypothetical protein
VSFDLFSQFMAESPGAPSFLVASDTLTFGMSAQRPRIMLCWGVCFTSIWEFSCCRRSGFTSQLFLPLSPWQALGWCRLGLLRRLYSGWAEQLLATCANLDHRDLVKWAWEGLSLDSNNTLYRADALRFPVPFINFFIIFLGAALVVFL